MQINGLDLFQVVPDSTPTIIAKGFSFEALDS